MKTRYLRIFSNFLFVLLLSVFQVSFVSNLPAPLNYADVLLAALLFVLVLADIEKAFWWALGFGIVSGIYSFLPFGFTLLAFLSALFLTNYLFANFFTDKSLFSFLALGVSISFCYGIILNFLVFFERFFWGEGGFSLAEWNLGVGFLKSFFINSILIIILFYLNSFVGNRLKPVFLVKTEQK